MNYNYSYEMDLEYFADQNDFEIFEDDQNDFFIYIDKEDYSKEKLLKIIEDGGFDFEVFEYNDHYRIK
jgi:hypothetical protein